MNARQILSEVTSRWHAGDQPNAAAVLESNPELKKHHSVILDLVYEEYCMREEAGETINLASFSNRFPTIQKSLSRLLVVHQLIQQEPAYKQIRWPVVGESLFGDEFTIIEKLGQGAFAQVFLCQDHVHRRQVVVKISADATSEAYTLGKLQHSGIVPVLDVRSGNEMTGIVMPYLGRNTMCHLLDAMSVSDIPTRSAAEIVAALPNQERIELPSDELSREVPPELDRVEGMLWIAAQLAESLAYAHACDILHGDIKPSNILLTAKGYPMLLDFNLAQDAQRRSARVGGTIPYMAPEQLYQLFVASPDSVDESFYDTRSEVFSLGVILYELLTGRLPFGDYQENAGDDLAIECIASQESGPPPINQTDVGNDVSDVVVRCLQFESHHRFPNMLELQDALLRLCTVEKHAKLTRRTLLIGSTLALAGGGSLVASIGHKDTFSAAVEAYQHRDFESAIQLFTEVLDENPNHPSATYLRGRARMHQNHFGAAANDFTASFQFTENPTDLTMAGYCWQQEGQLTAAAEAYEECLRLDNQSYPSWNNLGCVRAHTDHGDLAAECFDRAWQLRQHETHLFNRVTAGNELRGEEPPSATLLRLTETLATLLNDAATGEPLIDLPNSLTPLESLLIGEIYLAAFESRPDLVPLGMALLIQAREFRQPTGNSVPTLPTALAKKYAAEMSRLRSGQKRQRPSYTYFVPSPERTFDISRFLDPA